MAILIVGLKFFSYSFLTDKRGGHFMKYYFSKTLSIPFDDAVVKVTEELKKKALGF
jgi:hypothetical protein